MSPLFGHKEVPQESDPGLQAEVDRLGSLPLPQLAAEVMVRGFGPGGPGEDQAGSVTVEGGNINAGTTVPEIAARFAPGDSARGADEALRLRLHRLVAEGVQVLEHASLVRIQMHTAMNGLDYALTRLGRAALESGSVERLLAGESPSQPSTGSP